MTKAPWLAVVMSLLTVSSFAFAGLAKAGAVPDGFIGVPWGASADQVKQIMNERGYTQLKGSATGLLVFKGAFAGVPCQLLFYLIANSFYSGTAEICSRSGYALRPQSTYKQTVDMLSEKYGPPQTRQSRKLKDNNGKEHPQEGAQWTLTDSKTSDSFTIRADFGVTWFMDDTRDQYVADFHYSADSLHKRLKTKEY